jgi:hypothetical protein
MDELQTELHRQHLIHFGSLLIVLMDSGVITNEQYEKALAQATSEADQILADMREQARADSLSVNSDQPGIEQ